MVTPFLPDYVYLSVYKIHLSIIDNGIFGGLCDIVSTCYIEDNHVTSSCIVDRIA